jgi:hypothetical protein
MKTEREISNKGEENRGRWRARVSYVDGEVI